MAGDDDQLTGTAGTDLEDSEAGTADKVVGTPGWAAASGAAQLEHEAEEREAAKRRAAADPGAGEAGPGGTPGYGTSGQEGQGASGAERPADATR